ncbi:MAG: hypothetical protein AAF591_15260 [Verrucomicrobiota bacterium]
MNTFGFLLSSLGKQLGIRRRAAWRTAINREHHLLKSAEQSLGEQAWKEVENIEELAIEYWEIKDIENQQLELEKRNRSLEEEVETSRIERESITGQIDESLEQKRGELIDKNSALDAITSEIEQLQHEKRVIEKRFEALKLKRKVLIEQDENAPEAQTIYESLKSLKEEHIAKKQALADRKRDSIDAESEITNFNAELNDLQESVRQKTAGVTEDFNQLSRRVAQNRARIGALELTKNRAFVRIGRHLGLNRDAGGGELQIVCRNHRSMVSRIIRLRRSISFHRRLAGDR